jgi:hypothetical protein
VTRPSTYICADDSGGFAGKRGNGKRKIAIKGNALAALFLQKASNSDVVIRAMRVSVAT